MARSSAVTSGTVPSSRVEWLTARPVQLRGSRIARALLALAGWRVLFDGLPGRQGVVILYPHTSNWDFVVGVLAKWSIGIPLRFWGKDTLFEVPLFGRWLRWLGGIPVRRDAPKGMVGAMIERMKAAVASNEFFWLALAPEGTRRRAEGWRSGFYQVAVQAGVPLLLAYMDYPSRRVGVSDALRLSGEPQADIDAIATRLAAHRGLRPEAASPIRWLD